MPADGPALSAMAARCFTDTFGSMYRMEDLRAFLDETFGEHLPSHLCDPDYRVQLAVEDDAIVGFAKTGPVFFPGDWDAQTIELHQLYILGPWQGTGVAPELMRWAMDSAREAGFTRMVLSVFVDNIRAQRFYARHDFAEVGTYAFRVGETIDDDRIWACTL
ncbi:ribosomal protein S18 acetylase RimI-like enzyme [Stakelama sediminis]|uniref:Ribosomal protein S18 acetylase RimI-like enzyme n=1 Tax=Stakelama sediminis TaxID=463200 RepID=A0A840YW86_9SPHN|nr:ribosomal protein S18 acetylase RimI-like enzyme [Stakelama sediminis]